MFEIPVGARHVQIEEMEPVSHTIGKNRLPRKQVVYCTVDSEGYLTNTHQKIEGLNLVKLSSNKTDF